MSVLRKDDRHNEDLVGEISDSFNRALSKKKAEDGEPAAEQPRFVVTGDSRAKTRKKRDSR
ncbi:MAG: hypothetical protein JWQ81_2981 [Amycolatopsis sp.]|jgi:hypothetical protein|uniref:hypothetical protein n=1 Tax=Amycolatopsis sp. TaxID=37632 RepID=UPI0026052B7F|nr:hypothetical protein [Amycolatopsis sp.]MCU1682242.1 hypothetical protein [Amycolatopsis sp.]